MPLVRLASWQSSYLQDSYGVVSNYTLRNWFSLEFLVSIESESLSIKTFIFDIFRVFGL